MKLETQMATRNPSMPAQKPGDVRTEFQLYKSQLNVADSRNLIDYTENRLLKYIEQLKDKKQIITIRTILEEYKKGFVAIAWKSGRPSWISVTKESG